MKPLGIRPVRFNSKRDVHPPKGYVNWWEKEFNKLCNKKKEKRNSIISELKSEGLIK